MRRIGKGEVCRERERIRQEGRRDGRRKANWQGKTGREKDEKERQGRKG